MAPEAARVSRNSLTAATSLPRYSGRTSIAIEGLRAPLRYHFGQKTPNSITSWKQRCRETLRCQLNLAAVADYSCLPIVGTRPLNAFGTLLVILLINPGKPS